MGRKPRSDKLTVAVDREIASFVKRKALKSGSSETRQGYRGVLLRFFRSVGMTPTKFAKKANWQDRILAYFESIKDRAPMTKVHDASIIRSYLKTLKLTAPDEFWSDLKPRARAVTREKIFTPEQLRQLMKALSLQGRGLLTVMVSSGMRISEALSLRIEDLDLEANPATATLRPENTKNRLGRTCYISQEAVEYLKVIVQDRKPSEFVFLNQKGQRRNRASAERVFWKAFRQLGIDNEFDSRTHRRLYRLHNFRKVFFTRACQVMPRVYAELLLGHETGMSNAYLRPQEGELADYYKKLEPLVTIEGGQRTFSNADLKLEVAVQTLYSMGLLAGIEVDSIYHDESITLAEKRDKLQQVVMPALRERLWQTNGASFTAPI